MISRISSSTNWKILRVLRWRLPTISCINHRLKLVEQVISLWLMRSYVVQVTINWTEAVQIASGALRGPTPVSQNGNSCPVLGTQTSNTHDYVVWNCIHEVLSSGAGTTNYLVSLLIRCRSNSQRVPCPFYPSGPTTPSQIELLCNTTVVVRHPVLGS